MKKTIFILTIACLLLSSCDVLDVKPQSSIIASEAFKDKKGIEKGVLGSYAPFQNFSYYGRNYLIFSDLASDNLNSPSGATSVDYRQVDNNDINAANGAVSGIWSSGYESINNANNVIVKVPDIADMTAEEKNIALGELYFIRALSHFNLMNFFGDIPLKITPTVGTSGLNVPRNPKSEVYDQIIKDLTFAETHLVAGGPKSRASKFAATALLARVFLYQGDYAKAKSKATEVIGGNYNLLNDYAEIFTDESAEVIFEIDFTALNRNRIAEYNFPRTINGRGEVAPSTNLLNAYENNDQRLAASLAYAGALPYAIKYDDLAVGADNVIILRLAEMYLIRAEAEAQLGGTISDIKSDINVIRARAGLAATAASTLPSLLAAIEQERWVEFAFEGHRWFDLVRTNRAVNVLPNVTSIDQTLFPIPLDEILTNTNTNLKQNPGY